MGETQNHPQATRRKRRRGRKRELELCSVPACGRPRYASGLCQTHQRQKRTTGRLKPIRPYRKRTPGTVKFAGFRLTSTCADRLGAYAKDRGISHGAAIADVLEGWSKKRESWDTEE